MSGLIHRIPPHLRSWTTVAAILGVALLFNGLAVVLLIGQWGNIGLSRGESMAPNSDDGTVDFTFRFIYRLREPRRGEVVAIEPSFADGEKLGKRVIGLPGETVTIDGTRVLIDGVELHEPYVRLPWTEEWYDEWQLGPDEYWVMGDNRDHSFDSRSFGPLDEADIVAPMLPIVPLSRLDPLAVVGLVGLLALFPGAPVAGYLGNRRLARRFGRSAWWGLPGALFLGLTTAALLVAGPRRPGPERPNAVTAEFATPTAEWRTVTLGLTKASSWALAGYLAGGAVDAAVPGAIVAGCLWAVTDSLVRAKFLPAALLPWIFWEPLSFLGAFAVAALTTDDHAERVLFGLVVAGGPWVLRPMLRYLPPVAARTAAASWAEVYAGQATWWATAAMTLPLGDRPPYVFIITSAFLALALGRGAGNARGWLFEAVSAVAVCVPLALGLDEVLGRSGSSWVLRALAGLWLFMTVRDCWRPPKTAIPPATEEMQVAA